MSTNLWNKERLIDNEWSAGDSMEFDGNALNALITVSSLPVSAQLPDGEYYDYYFVEHSLVVDPHQCFVKDSGDDKKWWARTYKLSVQPYYGPTDDGRLVQLLPGDITPMTTQSGQTISTGTNFTLGGHVGTFGDVPTTGVNASYSVSNSHTYTIPDVSVQMNLSNGNYRGDSFRNPVGVDWTFEFAKPEFDDGGLFHEAHFESVCKAGKSAFEMSTYQIYQVHPRYYETIGQHCFKVNSVLTATLGHAYINHTLGLSTSWHRKYQTHRGQFETEIKRPPTPH